MVITIRHHLSFLLIIGLFIGACGVSSGQPAAISATSLQASHQDSVHQSSVQPAAALVLSVDVSSPQHAISPLIYGINNFGMSNSEYAALVAALHIPVVRWGGNDKTRYNWQNDFTNLGNDWYFQNIPSENPDNSQLPNNSAADRFVQRNRDAHVDSLITIPMIGWVAKATSSAVHPYTCGFSVSLYTAQQDADPFDTDCGNGILLNGNPVVGNAPTDTSIAVGAPFVQGWVTHLSSRFGAASSSGVRFYGLDNEPGLWPETHRDVFPGHLSYQDLVNRTIAYAAAIRAADSSAQILGPVQDGWTRYFYSSYGTYPDATAQADRDNHSGEPFVAWYLDQLHAYEQQHGTRLIDYFDLHYYPQATGVSLSPAGNAATQALRLRSTRALWDASYVDESWIKDTESGNTAVQLLPRMREWIAQHHPGLKIAISEYNWGALDNINGALAQADVLGIFGREQVDLATLWDPPTVNEPGAFAFRMYRNYDGLGHAFGDLSLLASSSDQAQLAIYAARRSIDGALTVMVINKTNATQAAQISLGAIDSSVAARFQYSGAANVAAIEPQPAATISAGSLSANFPAASITLFVVPGNANNRGYLPLIRRP
jgi:hypothetical protein